MRHTVDTQPRSASFCLGTLGAEWAAWTGRRWDVPTKLVIDATVHVHRPQATIDIDYQNVARELHTQFIAAYSGEDDAANAFAAWRSAISSVAGATGDELRGLLADIDPDPIPTPIELRPPTTSARHAPDRTSVEHTSQAPTDQSSSMHMTITRTASVALASFALMTGTASARPHIIGGSNGAGTALGMVARIVDNLGNETELCSGTVVASNAILTAGHCAENTTTGIVDPAAGYQVLTGTQSLDSPGQVSGVSQVIPYPLFSLGTRQGDAALLILSTPTTVAPVAVASDPADAGYYAAGTGTVIAGWGIDDSYSDTPDTLQYGFTVVQSATDCEQRAGEMNDAFNPNTQLCAIDAPTYSTGTCNGDSGGPILTSVNSSWVELGLTSFGEQGCDTNQADFFTRTDTIDPWIATEIASHQPAPVAAPPPPAASPAPAPAPTPAPKPENGVYVGRTGQKQPFKITVGATETAVGNASFGFKLRCTRHRLLSYTIKPGLTWRLNADNGMAFSSRFYDRSGTRYALTGQFTSVGNAIGTLAITWRTRRYGDCDSGTVGWRATR